MKEVKGGTFSNIDFNLIKNSLYTYKEYILNENLVDLEKEKVLSQIGNLLHRLGRVS